MEQIKVVIGREKKEYSVLVGTSILPELLKFIQSKHNDKKVVIITEDNVKKLYGDKLMGILKHVKPYMISVPSGEESKSRKIKQEIEDKLLENRYGRDTVIVAFGGGVIGDLAGFVAATFNRGIPVIQVPTTLLAMVDSSIGGKTGIDTKYGKNLIGAIWQPDAVFADLGFFGTLPTEDFLNGLAEVIKMAIILDKELFLFIEENYKKILKKEKDALLRIIRRSIELKRDVVEKDESEEGLRQILNFGHTIGHGLEAYYRYRKKHGQCVSVGMAVESQISELAGSLSEYNKRRVVSLLECVGLPAKVDKNIKVARLADFMRRDKKVRKQKIKCVLLSGIGKVKKEKSGFSHEIGEDIIGKAIELCKDD
jgi:3-dehydroquinate synthase